MGFVNLMGELDAVRYLGWDEDFWDGVLARLSMIRHTIRRDYTTRHTTYDMVLYSDAIRLDLDLDSFYFYHYHYHYSYPIRIGATLIYSLAFLHNLHAHMD